MKGTLPSLQVRLSSASNLWHEGPRNSTQSVPLSRCTSIICPLAQERLKARILQFYKYTWTLAVRHRHCVWRSLDERPTPACALCGLELVRSTTSYSLNTTYLAIPPSCLPSRVTSLSERFFQLCHVQ